jgi:phenylalanyl-tRNA synthetase beta chain
VGEYGAHEGRRRAARRALNACGFDEALTFSFIDTAHDEQFELLPELVQRTDESSRLVTLSNPIIEGAARMRPTLLPGLLESVRHNFNHGTRDVRLFEMGRVFAAGVEADGRPREIEACALVATGVATEEGHAGASRELDFYDLKGALESALDAMNVASPEFAATSARHLRKGRRRKFCSRGAPPARSAGWPTVWRPPTNSSSRSSSPRLISQPSSPRARRACATFRSRASPRSCATRRSSRDGA